MGPSVLAVSRRGKQSYHQGSCKVDAATVPGEQNGERDRVTSLSATGLWGRVRSYRSILNFGGNVALPQPAMRRTALQPLVTQTSACFYLQKADKIIRVPLLVEMSLRSNT